MTDKINNPDRLYDVTKPNRRTTTRCCAKCGKTGTGTVTATDGPWRLSKSHKHILCGPCWNEKYFIDELRGRITLRRDGVSVLHGSGEMMVHKSDAKEFVCPISGAKYMGLGGDRTGDLLLLETKWTPTPRVNSDWAYLQDMVPIFSRVAGLRYEEGGDDFLRRHNERGDTTGVVLRDATGRGYTLSTRNQRYIFRLEDCVQLECEKYVHATEKNYYAKRCKITGKTFFSTRAASFSKEGEELMRRKDVVLCTSCGSPCKPEESMVRDGKLICQSCAADGGSVYYDGAPYATGTGRSIGIEMELEVLPAGQLRVQKIPGVDVSADDMIGRPVVMNIPPVSAHEDGSLRGKHPVEYVSPILYESNYSNWVRSVCDAIRGNTRVYSRAGLHVHFGTKDFSWLDLLNLGCHAQLYERLYASMVAPSRWNNSFVTHLPDFIHAAKRITSKSEFMLWFYGKRELGIEGKRSRRANEMQNRAFPRGVVHRYQWLNLHSHVFRRTVEVRLHHATAQPDKIINWAGLWLNVVNHIGSGGDWKVSPLELADKTLRTYYQERILKFSHMTTDGGLTLDHTHPNGLKRARGLMSTDEKWAREKSGEAPKDNMIESRALAITMLRNIRDRGCPLDAGAVRVSRRIVTALLEDMEHWIGTVCTIHRPNDEEEPFEITLSQQPVPGIRQAAEWHYEDGETDPIRGSGAEATAGPPQNAVGNIAEVRVGTLTAQVGPDFEAMEDVAGDVEQARRQVQERIMRTAAQARIVQRLPAWANYYQPPPWAEEQALPARPQNDTDPLAF